MTAPYLSDPRTKTARACVVAHTPEGGVVVDAPLFFPRGGGQPGDSGRLAWDGGEMEVATTVTAQGGAVLVPAVAGALPPVGVVVEQAIDWDRRWRHMRMHTALHLLSAVVRLPVTGGQVGAAKSRLDFLMPEVVHGREAIQAGLDALVAADHPVTAEWVDEAELDARPELVRTLSVKPPRGAGRVRLVRIGTGEPPVDLQPCGGTHVARTGEVGRVVVGRIESKGRANRRVSVTLED